MSRLFSSSACALAAAFYFASGCRQEPTAVPDAGSNSLRLDVSTECLADRSIGEHGEDDHGGHRTCAGPVITTQPADVTIPANNSATFSVIATSSTPLTYQWSMNGMPISGATSSAYVTVVNMSDSGSTFRVVVSNSAGSTSSGAAHLSVTGTRYGLGGVQAEFPSVVTDLIGVKYHFIVKTNQSPTIKILFGFNRLIGPGSSIVYPFEVNVYSDRLSYADGACALFPPAGTDIEAQASVRPAIADYPLTWGLQPGVTTGLRTTNPIVFPVTSYFVDNIATLPKSDAISQFDVGGTEIGVTIQRSDTTSDLSSYSHCGRALLSGLYRRWSIKLEAVGHPSVIEEVVVPETSGRFLSPGVSGGATGLNALEFFSEFLNSPGTFTVQYWGFASMRESTRRWTPVTTFTTTYQYDGNGTAYGIRVVKHHGTPRIEFSNVPSVYLARNTPIVLK